MHISFVRIFLPEEHFVLVNTRFSALRKMTFESTQYLTAYRFFDDDEP